MGDGTRGYAVVVSLLMARCINWTHLGLRSDKRQCVTQCAVEKQMTAGPESRVVKAEEFSQRPRHRLPASYLKPTWNESFLPPPLVMTRTEQSNKLASPWEEQCHVDLDFWLEFLKRLSLPCLVTTPSRQAPQLSAGQAERRPWSRPGASLAFFVRLSAI